MADELSPDEAAQIAEADRPDSAPPQELSPEQADALMHSGKVEDVAPKAELNPDEAEHLHATSIMNGTYGQGPVPVDDQVGFGSGNTRAAANDFYATHDSIFRKTLYSLNLPQQFLMRQVTAALAGMGTMDAGTAKQLLSENEISPHDVINYYWKPPPTQGENPLDPAGVEKPMRMVTGFVADMVLDPLNMIGVGEVDKAVTIAGKTITGLEKMSTAQRATFEALGGIEKIIQEDGQILHAGDTAKAASTVNDNLDLLAKARDGALAGNPLSFDGLKQAMNLSEDAELASQNVILQSLKEKSAAELLATGAKELTIGLKLPFTNFALETRIPGPMSEVIGKGMQKVGNAGMVGAAAGAATAGPLGAAVGGATGTLLNTMGPTALKGMDAIAEGIKAVRSMSPDELASAERSTRAIRALSDVFGLDQAYSAVRGIPSEAYRLFQGLWTKTNDSMFNQGLMNSLNLKGATAQYLSQQTSKWNEGLQAVTERLGPNRFKGIMNDVVDELEKGVFTKEEAFGMAEKAGVPTNSPLVDKLHIPSLGDSERLARIQQHPELVDMIDTMRRQLKSMVGKYDERGIPFDELNPFGEGWMNRYVKHAYTDRWKDYLKSKGAADNAFEKAMMDSGELIGKFDSSALGRSYRGGILEANEASMKTAGIKMFVDDPVQLFNMRVQEMQNAVAKHDLIKSAMPGSITGFNPGSGWVRANPDHFGHLESVGAVGGSELEVLGSEGLSTEKKVYKALSFVPPELRDSLQRGERVYFQSDVYDKMLWNTQKEAAGSFSQMRATMAAADAYTSLWRNGVLANTGYIGTKWFHNMLSYFGLMGNYNPKYLMKTAAAMMLPDAGFVGKLPGYAEEVGTATREGIGFDHTLIDGTKNTYNNQQFLELAGKHGLVGTGGNVLFDDVLDHMASAYARNKTIRQPGVISNYVYGFAAYRGLAQYGDDLPKLAVFAQRLEEGFTAEAAAEAATRYFYNFKPVTAEQTAMKALVPFISFPMKTAELVASQIKAGDLFQLAMPGHVQSILEGKWVEDRDTRDYLSKVLPGMKNWYDPLHGGITPGMRSMAVELPWCYNTLSALWSEDSRLHPIFQLLAGAMAVKHDGNELDQPMDVKEFSRVVGSGLENTLTPQPIRMALTLLDINGAIPKGLGGGHFVEKYQTTPPDPGQYLAMMAGKNNMEIMSGSPSEENPTGEPSDLQLQKAVLSEKFKNATEFGQWMDKSYGSNWLYNTIFHGSLQAKGDDVYASEGAAVRGEFVRQHIKDMSLGLVEMDKLDSTMFSKYFAIDREEKKAKTQMLAEATKTYQLSDPNKVMSDEAMQEAMKAGDPLAKKVLALRSEKNAVVAYYDYILKAQKTSPDFSIHRLLLGIDTFQMSSDGKPPPETMKALYPKANKISDDRSQGFTFDSIMHKWNPK